MESIFSRSPALAPGHSDSRPVGRHGFFGRLLGCWHRSMSRPFTRDGETYRVCTKCGAHRMFDVVGWRMRGPYYFSPPSPASSPYHATKTCSPASARALPVSDLPVQDQDGHLM
jgi:hypothetical protein